MKKKLELKVKEGRALLVKRPEDYVAALEGLGKEVWKALGGGDAYIRKERTAWGKKEITEINVELI